MGDTDIPPSKRLYMETIDGDHSDVIPCSRTLHEEMRQKRDERRKTRRQKNPPRTRSGGKSLSRARNEPPLYGDFQHPAINCRNVPEMSPDWSNCPPKKVGKSRRQIVSGFGFVALVN